MRLLRLADVAAAAAMSGLYQETRLSALRLAGWSMTVRGVVWGLGVRREGLRGLVVRGWSWHGRIGLGCAGLGVERERLGWVVRG